MEAVQTSETSVNSHQTTRLYSPEDSHFRENLKSYANKTHLRRANRGVVFNLAGTTLMPLLEAGSVFDFI
jgi:hypothetical protein